MFDTAILNIFIITSFTVSRSIWESNVYQVVLNSYLPRGIFLLGSVGKLQSNLLRDGIYLFREHSNNCKSVRSIDKLLYLAAQLLHELLELLCL